MSIELKYVDPAIERFSKDAPFILIVIKNKNLKRRFSALLDSGSSHTLIPKSLAE